MTYFVNNRIDKGKRVREWGTSLTLLPPIKSIDFGPIKSTRDRPFEEATKRVTRSMSKSGSQLVQPLEFPRRSVNFSSTSSSCHPVSGTLSGTPDSCGEPHKMPPDVDQVNTFLEEPLGVGGVPTTSEPVAPNFPEIPICSLSDLEDDARVTSLEPLRTQSLPSGAVAKELSKQEVEFQPGYLNKFKVQVTLRDDDFF